MITHWGNEIELLVPIEDAWEFLVESGRDLEWRAPWARGLRSLTPGPVAVGCRYETDYNLLNRAETVTVEITEIEPPRLLAWRQTSESTFITPDSRYELVSTGSGTRLRVHGTLEGHGPASLGLGLFAAYMSRYVLPRQLLRLQRLLART